MCTYRTVLVFVLYLFYFQYVTSFLSTNYRSPEMPLWEVVFSFIGGKIGVIGRILYNLLISSIYNTFLYLYIGEF